jgi:hypothetical protein
MTDKPAHTPTVRRKDDVKFVALIVFLVLGLIWRLTKVFEDDPKAAKTEEEERSAKRRMVRELFSYSSRKKAE